MTLTVERLKEVLHYDPETGVFTRLVTTSWNARAGTIAGHTRRDGYRIISVDSTELYGHRLAWLYVTGAWPVEDIDHVDGDTSNNRFSNLRAATPSQNLGNSKLSKHNKSGLKGVHWKTNENKWCAQIMVANRRINLGVFDCKFEAHAAYCATAEKLRGEFARVA